MVDRADTKPPRLLVVEDEPDIGALLEYVLGQEGYSVHIAAQGQDALDQIKRQLPDLVVLDLMLPDMSGLDILQHVRRLDPDDRVRVIILSARKDEDDRIRGFELGADDYMIKPFSPRELILRIRTILKRDEGEDTVGVRTLIAGPIAMDLERHETRVDGKLVHLTLTEFQLLADMVRNQGRVRTRDVLMSEVWEYDTEAMSRTVDTHVRRLRNKLGPAAHWLSTVRGMGYQIRDPERS